MSIRIFVDSDVIISSLISQKGAAYLLIHDARIDRFISNISFSEVKRVVGVLHLSEKELQKLIDTRCHIISIADKKRTFLKRMTKYTGDTNDAHIVLGAKQSNAKFLVNYNMKHYRIEKIREDLGIIVLTPAFLLQYLRSVH